MCLSSTCVFSLVNSCSYHLYFLIGSFIFLLLNSEILFCILDTRPSLGLQFTSIFSHSMPWLFIFFQVFHREEVLILRCNLQFFLLWIVLLPRLRSLRFSLIFFSSQKFCSFRFYIYVSDSLNFCINCETLKLIFFLLPMEFFLLQYRLQKKPFFLCGIAYVPCQKSAGSVSRFSVLFINLFVRPSAGIAKPLLSLYDMS